MNIQEFHTSRTHKKIEPLKSLTSTDYISDPNKDHLSKLINECDAHTTDIHSGISKLSDNLKLYKIEQAQYDLVRDTLKEVDIANHYRLEKIYQY